MSFTKSRLFLLFLKITIPIIIVILISGFFLYQKMENEKALLMEHSAQTFSKLISSVYKFDKRSFNKKKVQLLDRRSNTSTNPINTTKYATN